jgi:hypothetical protein
MPLCCFVVSRQIRSLEKGRKQQLLASRSQFQNVEKLPALQRCNYATSIRNELCFRQRFVKPLTPLTGIALKTKDKNFVYDKKQIEASKQQWKTTGQL